MVEITMPYERTQQIEQRFQRVIQLIAKDSLNARQLAEALNVSPATMQRIIAALKERGYQIRSVHDTHGWRYELMNNPRSADRGDA